MLQVPATTVYATVRFDISISNVRVRRQNLISEISTKIFIFPKSVS